MPRVCTCSSQQCFHQHFVLHGTDLANTNMQKRQHDTEQKRPNPPRILQLVKTTTSWTWSNSRERVNRWEPKQPKDGQRYSFYINYIRHLLHCPWGNVWLGRQWCTQQQTHNDTLHTENMESISHGFEINNINTNQKLYSFFALTENVQHQDMRSGHFSSASSTCDSWFSRSHRSHRRCLTPATWYFQDWFQRLSSYLTVCLVPVFLPSRSLRSSDSSSRFSRFILGADRAAAARRGRFFYSLFVSCVFIVLVLSLLWSEAALPPSPPERQS